MATEKRMIENFTVLQSLSLGDRELVLGVNKDAALPYMTCYCSGSGSPAWPTEVAASKDYLEALEVFADRIKHQIREVRSELGRFPYDMDPFSAEDCLPLDWDSGVLGKVLVLRPESLRPEYQHGAYQLIHAQAGSGRRGSPVFGTFLATGDKGRWKRADVLGEIRPERLPRWARRRLDLCLELLEAQPRKEEPEQWT